MPKSKIPDYNRSLAGVAPDARRYPNAARIGTEVAQGRYATRRSAQSLVLYDARLVKDVPTPINQKCVLPSGHAVAEIAKGMLLTCPGLRHVNNATKRAYLLDQLLEGVAERPTLNQLLFIARYTSSRLDTAMRLACRHDGDTELADQRGFWRALNIPNTGTAASRVRQYVARLAQSAAKTAVSNCTRAQRILDRHKISGSAPVAKARDGADYGPVHWDQIGA